MRSLLLNNLRAHARRYVATGVAIAISVAFVLAALSFGVAIKDSLSQGVRDTYEGSSVVIDVSGGDITDQQLVAASDTVRGVDGVNAVIVQRVTYLELSHNGKRLGASVKSGNPAPLHQPKLSEGTMPSDSGTIAIPTSTADALGLKVGDKVHVATAMSSESMEMDLTVSGLVDAGGLLSNATAITNDQNALEGGYISKVFVIANQGVDASELTTRIAAKLDNTSYSVQTSEAATQADLDRINMDSATTTAMIMVFPAIAIVVALIVVSTTFQVTVEQRRRELALLRCVGATGKQVKRLLLQETLLVGLVGSAIGLALGCVFVGLGLWASGISDTFVEALGTVRPLTALLVLVFGTLLTVLAGRKPAKGVTRIPPLAALQAEDGQPGAKVRRRYGFTIIATLLTVAGLGAAWYGISMVHSGEDANLELGFLCALGGMMLGLVGTVMVASLLLPTIVRILGAPLRGVVGSLAAQNSVRNKSRTAATGTSVVIGITLVVLMLVGAVSLRTTLTTQIDSSFPVDLTVSRTAVSDDSYLTADQIDAISKIDGVAATVPVAQSAGTVTSADVPSAQTVVVDDVDLSSVAHNPISQVPEGSVFVSEGDVAGSTATVCIASTCKDLSVKVSDRAEAGTVLVNPADFVALGGDTQDVSSLVVKLTEDADVESVVTSINGVSDSLNAQGAAQERQMYENAINVALMVVVALLGVAVLVALVGVSNTLSLSVVERTRENGLLRAMGLTRRNMVTMLGVESVLVSLAAALTGTGLGILFGWIALESLPLNVSSMVLVIPWMQLAGVIALAIVAALLASIIPGRKAGRVSPVQALAHE